MTAHLRLVRRGGTAVTPRAPRLGCLVPCIAASCCRLQCRSPHGAGCADCDACDAAIMQEQERRPVVATHRTTVAPVRVVQNARCHERIITLAHLSRYREPPTNHECEERWRSVPSMVVSSSVQSLPSGLPQLGGHATAPPTAKPHASIGIPIPHNLSAACLITH